MSRLHEMKVGRLEPTKKTFKQTKETRNDKGSIFQRLKAFLQRDNNGD
jgi:hypothetical protein